MLLFLPCILLVIPNGISGYANCPDQPKPGSGPPASGALPTDPNNLPKSKLESWFTKDMFEDLFPYANIGWGPNKYWPYSYEAFMIAARYFPEFGTSSYNATYSYYQNTRRDLAAFFAHAIQETGANDASLYDGRRTDEEAADCYYRGGLFNWFEGGPTSGFLEKTAPGYHPEDGIKCYIGGKYCVNDQQNSYFFPCNEDKTSDDFFKGCYFGRGAIQISYNYNYGQFQDWLRSKNIIVDLLTEPNLVMTNMDPPLALMASLWFYMTPQPPKPAMHDIVLGNWNAGKTNEAAGYSGPIFGPTSLIINNECNGEDPENPGGPGESRRIKAFKWFCNYFKVPYGSEQTLSCKGMPQKFDMMRYPLSYQPDWSSTWKDVPCECAPATYGGMIPYYDPDHYPARFVALNKENAERCVETVYDNPSMYGMNAGTSACLNQQPLDCSGEEPHDLAQLIDNN